MTSNTPLPASAICPDNDDLHEVSPQQFMVQGRDTPFAVFQFDEGVTLEIHVPNTIRVVVAGHSAANEPVFLWVNPDGTIEDSGRLNIRGSSNDR